MEFALKLPRIYTILKMSLNVTLQSEMAPCKHLASQLANLDSETMLEIRSVASPGESKI
jgi:hypothetical protein